MFCFAFFNADRINNLNIQKQKLYNIMSTERISISEAFSRVAAIQNRMLDKISYILDSKANKEDVENIYVPSNISEFVNDKNYVTRAEVAQIQFVESDPIYAAQSSQFVLKDNFYYKNLPDTPDLEQYVLSSTYISLFTTVSQNTEKISDLQKTIDNFTLQVPTKVSELENDKNYITEFGSIYGNAETASSLKNYFTISLNGAVSGSVKLDGSTNVSLSSVFTSSAENYFKEILNNNKFYPKLKELSDFTLPQKTMYFINNEDAATLSSYINYKGFFGRATGTTISTVKVQPTSIELLKNNANTITLNGTDGSITALTVKAQSFQLTSGKTIATTDLIPSAMSQLTNDANYLKRGEIAYSEPEFEALSSSFALKGDIPENSDFTLTGLKEKSYNNLTDKPTIPSKFSELTNDSNFITKNIVSGNYSTTLDGDYILLEDTSSNMTLKIWPNQFEWNKTVGDTLYNHIINFNESGIKYDTGNINEANGLVQLNGNGLLPKSIIPSSILNSVTCFLNTSTNKIYDGNSQNSFIFSNDDSAKQTYFIVNGSLFFTEDGKTFTRIGTSEKWTQICGSSSTYQSYTEYAYGICDGHLYALNINNAPVEIDSSLTGWTKICGSSKTAFSGLGLGICSGKLYRITNNSAVLQIGSLTNWTDICGFSENAAGYGYGICDGYLYAITLDVSETSETQISTLSGWTKITGWSSESSNTFGYGICNGTLYCLQCKNAYNKGITNCTDVCGYSMYYANLSENSIIYAYALANNDLYLLKGNEAPVKIESTNKWAKITGWSKVIDNEYAYAITTGGNLYAIRGASLTNINASDDWTQINGHSNSNTTYAFGIDGGYFKVLSGTIEVLINNDSIYHYFYEITPEENIIYFDLTSKCFYTYSSNSYNKILDLRSELNIPSKLSELVNDTGFITAGGGLISTEADPLFAAQSSQFALAVNIPTKLSQLTNDVGYITESSGGGSSGGSTTTTEIQWTDIVNRPTNLSQFTNDRNYISSFTEKDPVYAAQSGQFALINKKTNISEFTNDTGYISTETDPIYIADKPNIALKSELFSKSYNDLTDAPTKLSNFENDQGYISSFTEKDPVYAAQSGQFALINKKTNISEFNNDVGYLTESSDLLSIINGKQDTSDSNSCKNIKSLKINDKVLIKWNDPDNESWKSTILIRKKGSYPSSISDGTTIVTVTDKNKYDSSKLLYLIDTLPDTTNTYYYRFFSKFSDGSMNVSLNNQVEINDLITFTDIHEIISGGLANKVWSVGDLIETTNTKFSNIQFEIQGFDVANLYDSTIKHSMTIWSKHLLEKHAYDDNSPEWDSSTLRTYLNSEDFINSFNEIGFKDLIADVKNTRATKSDETISIDKFWIPSVTELGKGIGSNNTNRNSTSNIDEGDSFSSIKNLSKSYQDDASNYGYYYTSSISYQQFDNDKLYIIKDTGDLAQTDDTHTLSGTYILGIAPACALI